MRVSIVGQTADRVVPPFQNSVGLLSWQLSCALGRAGHEISLFCSEAADHVQLPPHLDLISTAPARSDALGDRLWWKIRALQKRQGKEFGRPYSTSRLPSYALRRRTAKAVAASRADVILVHHSTQYLPLLRRASSGPLILLLEHELFPQSGRREMGRRLRHADLILTSSEAVRHSVVT